LAAPLVLLPTGRSWSLPRRAGAVALVGLVALTAGFSGHAGTGDDLIASMIADAHFGSVAIWLASLLALGAAVWPGQGAGLRRAVPRLTEIEAKAMGVIVVSGGLRLLAHLDDPRAMLGTGWGRLLLVKLAVLALLLGVGAATRRWAGERLGPVGDGEPAGPPAGWPAPPGRCRGAARGPDPGPVGRAGQPLAGAAGERLTAEHRARQLVTDCGYACGMPSLDEIAGRAASGRQGRRR
jgi:copper transport protein